MNEAQQYALALLTEECGETLQTIGKAGRFGIDTPGVKHPYTGIVDLTITPRTELEKELGDLMAAIDYAAAAGIVSASAVQSRRATKFEKLVNPESLDFDMTKAALALLQSKNCGDLTVGDLAAAISNAIAAAPQFVAGEVTREMCRRVVAAEAHDMHEWSPLDWLEAWRAELGPALWLVELKEPTPEECERICTEYERLLMREGTCGGRDAFDAVRAVLWPKEGL